MGGQPCDGAAALLQALHKLSPFLLCGYAAELDSCPANPLAQLAATVQGRKALQIAQSAREEAGEAAEAAQGALEAAGEAVEVAHAAAQHVAVLESRVLEQVQSRLLAAVSVMRVSHEAQATALKRRLDLWESGALKRRRCGHEQVRRGGEGRGHPCPAWPAGGCVCAARRRPPRPASRCAPRPALPHRSRPPANLLA